MPYRPVRAYLRILRATSAMTAVSLAAAPAFGLPQGGQVAGGQASIATSGGLTTVTQATDRGVINWQSFDIAHGEGVQIRQPSASSVTLNRVTGGGGASQIMGQLSANGTVMLVNPNGVIFGPTAQVNVGSLVATTADLADDRFLAGDLRFDKPGNPDAQVINQGDITVADAGLVALVAPGVRNDGRITARVGKVALASGDTFTLDLYGDGLVALEAGPTISRQLTSNGGEIAAEGGTVVLTAAAASEVVNQLVNMDGITQATSLAEVDGEIVLGGGVPARAPARVENTGRVSARGGRITASAEVVENTGTLDASAGGRVDLAGRNVSQQGTITADGGGGVTVVFGGSYLDNESSRTTARDGGSVRILGEEGSRSFLSGAYDASHDTGTGGTVTVQASDIKLFGARLDASGRDGGGVVRVGGEYQGGAGVMPATTTTVNGASRLTADAVARGDGGRVIVWSEGSTRFAGTATARGGVAGGDGGFIEISGRDRLTVHSDLARVDASSAAGRAGTVLFDPKNITISNSGLTGGASPSLLELIDPNAAAGNSFGGTVVALSTGNVVVTSTGDDFAASDAGAVYLFNGATGALISTLRGSTASDTVGSTGVVALTNGNYVVRSTSWDNGAVANAGAVTWGNGTTGISGTVSAANSLVGTTANDTVGGTGVVALSNGNYVVASADWDNGAIVNAGAVTWGNGTTGITGVVSVANSLVGSTAGDAVGNTGVTALTNGNYVVRSSNWDNGAVLEAGAVTWGDGTTGIAGVVSAANSLVGSTADDAVGSTGVMALTNGNYVVRSQNWSNGAVQEAGAVTWGNGATGISGAISAANSLVGSTAFDRVGNGGVTALTNGNYVVVSNLWDNGAVLNAGAVTWGSGTAGVSGAVSAANSLVGSTANDGVGGFGVTALTNGNYVVASANWDNGAVVNAGAATWGNGTTGVSGAVSAANSLVGSTASDQVGSGGVTALTNGNYVVASPNWNNGAVTGAGAATWGNGTTGITGVVSAANSLVGSTATNSVGSTGVMALTNGNYVVASSLWDNGAMSNVGAVTWGNGTTGITGVVSAANSLVGSTASDRVGLTGVTALTNGNYVVASHSWSNGAVLNAGAVTWGDGTVGISGAVSAANSLVGTTASNAVGSSGVTALTNGNYVVRSPGWDNGAVSNVGAVTWGSGTTGISGAVSAANSLVGSNFSDQVGNGVVTALSNGNYVVRSPNWRNGGMSNAGASTWGNGTTGVFGTITSGNSVIGPSAGAGLAEITADPVNNTYLTRFTTAGRVYVSSITGPSGGGPLGDYDGFSDSPSASVNLAPSFLLSVLNTGTAVVLQANNDITVADAITINNASGNGGHLTLQAGRSVLLNANVTTDNGNLTVIGNDLAASGVVDAHRDAGAAVITMASGVSVNAGTGAVSFELRTGAGNTNTTAGDITLRSVTAGSIFARNFNGTGDIVLPSGTALTASGTGTAITLASARNFLNSAGAGALSSPSGRWLVYSTAPASNTFGGLAAGFRRFSCTFGGSCPSFPGTGNGFLYSSTPVLTATPSAISLTYGDAAPGLAGYGYTLSGYQGGDAADDAVTGSLTGATPYTQGSNVGTYAVTYASGSLASALGYGFTYANNTSAITVSPRTLTAGLTGTVSRTYDGTTAATLAAGNYTLSGIFGSDAVSLNNPSAGTYDTKDVGSGKTVAVNGLSLTGAAAGNYQLASGSASGAVGSITARTLTISGVTAGNKVYDGTTAATLSGGSISTGTGLVAGDTVTLSTASATGMFADKNVGVGKSVSASGYTISGTDAGNYSLSQPTGLTADITQRLVSAGLTGAVAKTFDGTTVATLAGGNYLLTGVLGGDAVFVSHSGVGAYDTPAVGLGKLVTVTGLGLAGADAANYQLAAVSASGNVGRIDPAGAGPGSGTAGPAAGSPDSRRILMAQPVPLRRQAPPLEPLPTPLKEKTETFAPPSAGPRGEHAHPWISRILDLRVDKTLQELLGLPAVL